MCESTSTRYTRARSPERVRTDSEEPPCPSLVVGKSVPSGRSTTLRSLGRLGAGIYCSATRRRSGLCISKFGKPDCGGQPTSLKSWRKSGSCALGCSTWRRSGFCAFRYSMKKRSGSSASCCAMRNVENEEQKAEEDDIKIHGGEGEARSEEGANLVASFSELVPQVIGVAKRLLHEECSVMTVEELMGKRGQAVVFAWAYTLAQVLLEIPEIRMMKQTKDGCHYVEQWMSFLMNEACGLALGLGRFICYMVKHNMVIVEEKHDAAVGNPSGECDLSMHGQLRGGTEGEGPREAFLAYKCMDDNNDWIVNKRSKPIHSNGFEEEQKQKERQLSRRANVATSASHSTVSGSLRGGMAGNRFAVLAEEDEVEDAGSSESQSESGWTLVQKKKKKSYYSKVKINISAVKSPPGSLSDLSDGSSTEDEKVQEAPYAKSAALGNMEDMTRDSCGNEDELLRGGALGASTTAKKKQVAEAVQQMENILQSLQTQADQPQDEADGLILEMKKMVKAWEDKKPMKDEMRRQIEEMVKKLKGNGDGATSSQPSSGPQQPSRRQSFYAEFHKKAVEQAEERMQQQQRAKGKGKGKSKTKTKTKDGREVGNLPKYDLRPQAGVPYNGSELLDLSHERCRRRKRTIRCSHSLP